ncbi:MAG: thrombospondin type 3 repeat-containing protein [Roseibacillus sp.]|nr:thrombospondin type 3 repeat-containing protein [Roseibacillus sp.]
MFQFYDEDGIFAFTENYDDRVKIVATPISGATDLSSQGSDQQHTDVAWNIRTYANFDFGAGGWFNVDIWLTEDGGGAQSAADIGFGYYNDFSTNTADFGGIGYASVFGISSGVPAEFDIDDAGQSWGAYLDSFDPSLDSDGDNIPDGYEEQFFPGDLTQLGPGDFDQDGVNDPEEYVDGTDPTAPDADEDGSNDVQEKAAGTDPANPDTDGDGLLDGVETGTGTFVDANDTGTDPLAIDSDGDGASDSFEITENTDPNDPTSTPGAVTVQPSFAPINDSPSGIYVPNFAQPGLNYQENKYNPNTILNGQSLNNYNIHVSGSPAPNSSVGAIVPWASHGPGGNFSFRNSPFVAGGGDNFTVRYNGYLDMRSYSPGQYTIHLVSDDTNYFIMDTPDGTVIADDVNCCAERTQAFTISIPGIFPFDNVFGEQGGGEYTDIAISGPGIPGIVALGDTENGSPPVYPIIEDTTDSDGDTLPDGWETSWVGIDDLDQLTATGDFDQDGFTDVAEFTADTDPTDDDTDDDGLNDGDEAIAGTDPSNSDSDNDGLLDGVETNTGNFVSASDTGTDPLNADTD